MTPSWRDTAIIPDGAEPDPAAAETLASALRGTESAVAAFQTWRFEIPLFVAKMATVFVTTHRLLVSKDRILGRPKVDKAIDLEDIAGSTFGPLLGVGPTWEVAFRLQIGAPGTMYFDGPAQCEAVEGALRRAASALQAGDQLILRTPNTGTLRDGSAPPPEVQARVSRNYAFLEALRPLATPEMVGQPFGEQFGLEDALALISRYFPNEYEMRESHKMLCVDLLMATDQYFVPEDLDEIMGVTEVAFQESGVSPAQFGAVTSLSGAARSFLGQFGQEGAHLWEFWSKRDDVAAEFLCWHAVALLRLETTGKIPPLGDGP